MATTTKTERLAQQVHDLLEFKYGKETVTKLYDSASNVYLSMLAGKVLVKFEPQAALAVATNPVTGVANREFVPDVCRVGFDTGVFASDTVTLTTAVATKTVTINGSVFTAVAGAAANATQFTVAGTDTQDAAALAAAINASVDPLIVGVVTATSALGVVTIKAAVAGPAGNNITVASNDASMVVATAKLAGGTTTTVTSAHQAYVAAAVALTGVEVNFYAKEGIAVTDLTNGNLYQSFRNEWGFINQQ